VTETHDHLVEDIFLSRSQLIIDPDAKDFDSEVPENLCVTQSDDGFDRILESGKNVLLYFWSPSTELKSRIAKAKFSDLLEYTEILLAEELGTLPSRAPDQLISRILLEMSAALAAFAALQPGVPLKVSFCKALDRTCPLFHIDRVSLRMLCTFRGPGTEWLSDSMVNRKQLGRGSNRKVTKPGTLVYEVEPFQICILKGKSFKGNANAGAVHRSPAVPDTKNGRWFLRVDAAK
jgi:hypothetical protein